MLIPLLISHSAFCVMGSETKQSIKILQSVIEEDKKDLEALSGTLRTRADEATAAARRDYALACETAMRRLFVEASMLKSGGKPQGAGSHYEDCTVTGAQKQHREETLETVPTGKLDLRDFGALMVQLNLVPLRLTKTDALNIFNNTAYKQGPGSKELSYEKFKEAMRIVAKYAGILITEILGVPPLRKFSLRIPI